MGKGRAPCCAKVGLNKGSWTPEEDMRLIAYIQKYGHANWRALPKQAGLLRCGKSCRLRWINYLRPDLKRGNFTAEEEETLIKLHAMLGNKWSKIAACLPGRTDNEIKNVWNTHLKKRVAAASGGEKKNKKNTKNNKESGAKRQKKPDLPPAPSPSQSSSTTTTTTTTNCSSGDSAGEQQSNTSKETDALDNIMEIPTLDALGFDFDMLVQDTDPVPAQTSYCVPPPAAAASPCSSASPPCAADGELLDLPELDIVPELWSIIDGDAEAPWSNAAAACHVEAGEDGKEWWLEDLERELGLWGPMEDYQCINPGPQAQSGRVDPLSVSAGVELDPVSCYFQAGPAVATSALQGSEHSAVLTDNRMDL
ncbi:myb-related protein Zm1 [Brachypodium distachyon]|uniref:Uncharacterized protein n=1 Tax=Brachypodium distachyon TaxID=15368 RepID=I1J186_BRADI|nr:myb-related protein Zm1 [Brachypodium distachyon]KQJ84327.1 hypothetical protein BRADI_5g20130v3 [Brachypodium distachyon]|eukprot:XP_003580443.1 myb-related protein Zm1 [Brachypodium distachyon]